MGELTLTDPEMIYYGLQSGVVGLSKSELVQTVSSHDNSRYGYDKVGLISEYGWVGLIMGQNNIWKKLADLLVAKVELLEIDGSKCWPCKPHIRKAKWVLNGHVVAQLNLSFTTSIILNCKPLSFKGTEGVVVLSQWFKKMESIFHISNCAVENQVKFTTCTFLGNALTWWNSHMKTVTQDVSYAMGWKALKKMMTIA
ncbi:hypothetical protein Tco_0776421 [Tanacetum coccineum]